MKSLSLMQKHPMKWCKYILFFILCKTQSLPRSVATIKLEMSCLFLLFTISLKKFIILQLNCFAVFVMFCWCFFRFWQAIFICVLYVFQEVSKVDVDGV